MIEITKSPKTLLVFFLCFSIAAFTLVQLAGKKNHSETNLNGYFQLVENASLPILLADQKEQFSLQIGALVQDTPVIQVRIYDKAETLLIRVQNSSAQTAQEEIITLRNPLLFEGSTAGFLEIDLDPKVAYSGAGILGAFLVAVLLSLISTAALFLFSASERAITSGDISPSPSPNPTTDPLENQQATESAAEALANPHLLVVVKTLPPAQIPDETSLLQQVSSLSETISEMARIYAAEPLSTAANNMAFTIRGGTDKQSLRQATMLCWGLAELTAESTEPECDMEIQSFVLNPRDLSSNNRPSLNYWTEIDMRCKVGRTAGAFIAKSLTDGVDSASFELTPSGGDFLRISDATSSIKKLWQNQRAQRGNNA